jgi:type II secretory pathway predicted ATPase ExeA
VQLVYFHTQGYPRKIAMLCHDALETCVMQGASKVDLGIINGVIAMREDHAQR